MEILKLNNTIKEIVSSLDELNGRVETILKGSVKVKTKQ